MPPRVPSLTTTLGSRREGSLECTPEGSRHRNDSRHRREFSAGQGRTRLTPSTATEVVVQRGDHTLALGPWCEATELLGVRLRGLPRRRAEIDLDSHRPGDAVQRVDRRVGIRAFKLGDRRLADAGELRELGLGQAQVVAYPAQLEFYGELRFDRHPQHRALFGLERARRTWREYALLQVRLEPQLQRFLRFVLDVVAWRREGVAARAGREVCQQVLAFLGHDCREAHGYLRNLMPACFSMLLSVPIGKSPRCIGTVTRPAFVGWRYCACEPFVRTRSQPPAFRAATTSRAVTLYPS